MPIIDDPDLYDKARAIADKIYKKPSAYKSGFIVKKYKELGGKYTDDKEPKNLKRWFKEDWKDIGNKEYPVYRPTKRITKATPLTADEIDPKQAKKQIELKQKIKGEYNLPKFQLRLGSSKSNLEGLGLAPYDILPYTKKQAEKLGVKIEPSLRPEKKLDVYNKNGTKLLASVGARGYGDYPTFRKLYGDAYADRKRALYKARHEKDRHRVNSKGWFADQLLW